MTEPERIDKIAAWNKAAWEEHQNGGPTLEVTVSITRGDLGRVTDPVLAFYWHTAQHNPAPFGDHLAGEMVEAIGREIIRRWLGGITPELHRHQGRDSYKSQLTRFARWTGEEWVLKPEAIAEAAELIEEDR